MRLNNLDVTKKAINYNIEGLRGLLIIWIILFHYTTRYSELYLKDVPISFDNGGRVGVAMFFVISGYFLTRSLLENGNGWYNVAKFAINKYWRLYPAYLLSVVLIFAITNFNDAAMRTVDVKTFVINCLIIVHPKIAYVDGAHWFIASLIRMQIILGFLLLFRRNRENIIMLLSIIVLFFVVVNNLYSNYYLSKICSIVRMLDFLELLLGISIYLSIYTKEKYFYFLTILLCVCVALNTNLYLFSLYFAVLFILIHPLSDIVRNFINDTCILNNRILLYIGKISFTWYLIHQNIGYTIINSTSNYFLGIVLAIAITFFMAIMINIIVKKIPKYIL